MQAQSQVLVEGCCVLVSRLCGKSWSGFPPSVRVRRVGKSGLVPRSYIARSNMSKTELPIAIADTLMHTVCGGTSNGQLTTSTSDRPIPLPEVWQ